MTDKTKIILASITGLVLIILLPALIFGAKILLSDPAGQGNAIINRNDAKNRVAAQERFEVLYADILAADIKLDVLYAATVAQPDDRVASTNYTGGQAYCIDLRAQYDAESRKFSAEVFRAIDLPASIDTQSPSTDCKENS
jgi:hypothetical protein